MPLFGTAQTISCQEPRLAEKGQVCFGIAGWKSEGAWRCPSQCLGLPGLFAEQSLRSSEINVETFKGVVQPSGYIDSQADINRAVAVAQNVEGVMSVTNDMQVKKANP